MQLVTSAVASGFLLGGTFALIALGLVQVFRATNTFNFAHGQMMIVPAMAVASFTSRGADPVVSMVGGLVLGAVIGGAIYVLVMDRTVNQSPFVGFVATLGLAAVLDGLIQLLFGSDFRTIKSSFLPTGNVTLFEARISVQAVILAVVSIALAVAVAAWMRFTSRGTQVRAAGQDPVLAGQGGLPSRKLHLMSWCLAGFLGAAAGIIYTSTNVIDPTAVGVAFAAFPAIVLGGLDSIGGAVVGGLAIGFVQSFCATYLGGDYVDFVTYVILIIALLMFPSGLFGTRDSVRV